MRLEDLNSNQVILILFVIWSVGFWVTEGIENRKRAKHEKRDSEKN